MSWFVKFEVRPFGAIGIFSSRGISVIADSTDQAIDYARQAMNKLDLETRFPLEIYEYKENEIF